MDSNEFEDDTRRLQMYLLGSQGQDEDLEDEEEEYGDDLHPPGHYTLSRFEESDDFKTPESSQGSIYQQCVSTPSQSFHSPMGDYADQSLEEMDVDEEDAHSSQPPNLIELYKANLAYQQVIANAIEQVNEQLEQNHREQAAVRQILKLPPSKHEDTVSVCALWGDRLYGSPYFMDRRFVPAPPNTDARHFEEAGVVSLTFHNYTSWRKRETDVLVEEIFKQGLQKRNLAMLEEKKMLQDRLHPIFGSSSLDDKERARTEKRVEELSEKLNNMQNLKKKDVLGPVDAEHDWQKIANSLRFNMTKTGSLRISRTAEECRAYWICQGHPSLLKNSFPQHEENNLKRLLKNPLVDKNDIKTIASNFPGYPEFRIFRELRRLELSQLLDFTMEEEMLFALLCDANQGFYFYDLADKFMRRFPNHSYYQLHSLFNKKHCQTETVKIAKRFFSRQEDMIILEAYSAGLKPDDIARILPHRKVAAISLRYRKLKKLGFDNEYKSSWDKRDDTKLLQAVKAAKTWDQIQSSYFPERTPAEIERRHLFLKYHAEYVKRERNRKDQVTADLKGPFGKLASSAMASVRNKHYMKSFNSPKDVLFKVRRKAKCELQMYARPYFCLYGRARSQNRNPVSDVRSLQSRERAMHLFKYLQFLRAPLPKFIAKYNEDPSILEGPPCNNPSHGNYLPPAVKSHLIHLFSSGEFATEENMMQPVRVPSPEPTREEPISSHFLPQTSMSLLLLRSLLLHREYLILKCARNKPADDKKTQAPATQASAGFQPGTDSAASSSATVTEHDTNSENPADSQPVNGTTASSSADFVEQCGNGETPAQSEPIGDSAASSSSTAGDHSESAKNRCSAALELMFDRMFSVLHWPAISATKSPPTELLSAKEMLTVDNSSDGLSYQLGVRGGLIRPKKQPMSKKELKKFRSDVLKRMLEEKRNAKGEAGVIKPKEEEPKQKRKYCKTGAHKKSAAHGEPPLTRRSSRILNPDVSLHDTPSQPEEMSVDSSIGHDEMAET